MRHTIQATVVAAAMLGGITSAGCGDGDGTGDLTILVEPEVTITEGVAAGSGGADIRDGWSAHFDKYIVVIGDVDLHYATATSEEHGAGDLFAVDLTQVPASGLPLWSFSGVRAGDWELFYSIAGAADGAQRDESVSRADFDAMREGDWTYLIEGHIDNPDGESCPPAALAEPGDAMPNGNTNADDDDCYDNPQVAFELGVEAETLYGPCAIDGHQGVNVPSGGSQSAALTIHGDHLFFNGFPTGAEGGVRRLAQWWADADLNVDGEVTRDELERIAPADLAELDDRYNLSSGAPTLEEGETFENMWRYVIAQLKSQGHFQGEGECPVDGEEHAHGHEHEDEHGHEHENE